MPKIQINEALFYYEIHGEGHPLILISGYGADHTFWTPILSQLQQHFQVIVFDNRGSGQTKDKGEKLSASSMAKDIIALSRALSLKKPHIAGVSMGGTIAQTVASEYGNEVGSVALLVTVAKWREAMLLGVKSILSMRKKGCLFEDVFCAMLSWVCGESFLMDKERVGQFRNKMRENRFPQALQDQERQYEMLNSFDGREVLKNIQNSTCVIYGSQDILALPFEAQFLAEHIPHACIFEFKCGHGVVFEEPERLSKILIDFFHTAHLAPSIR